MSVTSPSTHPVRLIRRAQGMSMRELAERAHVHYETVEAVERGHRFPTGRVRDALSRALDVPPEVLFPELEYVHE